MTTIASDFAPVTFRSGNWFATLRKLLRRQRRLRYHSRTRRQRVLASLLATADERAQRDVGITMETVRRYDWLLDLARH